MMPFKKTKTYQILRVVLKTLEWLNTVIFKNILLDYVLNFSWRKSLSYRNQSIDLFWKSMDWYPYDRNFFNEEIIFKNPYIQFAEDFTDEIGGI